MVAVLRSCNLLPLVKSQPIAADVSLDAIEVRMNIEGYGYEHDE
jgi:hypothetical protein